MHYAVGDVHGCFEELKALLQVIERKDSNAQFIFVGDLIDRGANVWDTVQWARENITLDGKYQCVRGNHEELVIRWYEEAWLPWWKQGGFQSSIHMPETKYDFSLWLAGVDCLIPEKIEPIIHFFKTLPYQKKIQIVSKTGKNIQYQLTHAGAVFDEDVLKEEQEYYNLWIRNSTGNYANDTIVIHGHTPTIAREYYSTDFTAPGLIGYRKNAINLDGGCCYQNKLHNYPCMLCAICLETLREYYPYTLEERFRQLNRRKGQVETDVIIQEYKDNYLSKESSFRIELLKRIQN